MEKLKIFTKLHEELLPFKDKFFFAVRWYHFKFNASKRYSYLSYSKLKTVRLTIEEEILKDKDIGFYSWIISSIKEDIKKSNVYIYNQILGTYCIHFKLLENIK